MIQVHEICVLTKSTSVVWVLSRSSGRDNSPSHLRFTDPSPVSLLFPVMVLTLEPVEPRWRLGPSWCERVFSVRQICSLFVGYCFHVITIEVFTHINTSLDRFFDFYKFSTSFLTLLVYWFRSSCIRLPISLEISPTPIKFYVSFWSPFLTE